MQSTHRQVFEFDREEMGAAQKPLQVGVLIQVRPIIVWGRPCWVSNSAARLRENRILR
jgi:hypothetical protein